MPVVSFAQRITDLARAAPDRPAVSCGDDRATRAELEAAANRLARDLHERGVQRGDMVTLALPNSVDWFVAAAAAWKLGAIPQPVSARLPARELAAIVELAESAVVMGAEPGSFGATPCLPVGYRPADDVSAEPLPDVISPAWKAPTSGGSTGRPKLIVSGDPSTMDTDSVPVFHITPDGCMVMPGPLYHNGPLIWACTALLWGCHVVVLPRFDAEATLAAMAEHRADIVYLVPTMMKRIWRLPEEVRDAYDLSSLRAAWHLAEPCPPWLKEVWLDWLGPERLFELYGGTEAQATTVITGREWLAHRGSVGRPVTGEMSIRDADGTELPPGDHGEVWLRRTQDAPTYHYRGAEPKQLEGGWESLGDLGWMDADGYLYLADRLHDMILVGGSNVYPAEIEAALQEHPDVRSCVVFGLPDDELGNVVHAVVEADPGEVTDEQLLEFLAARLVRYKLPRQIEFVSEPLRDEAGKVRRSGWRADRLPSS